MSQQARRLQLTTSVTARPQRFCSRRAASRAPGWGGRWCRYPNTGAAAVLRRGGAHLPQQAYHLLGPGGDVLHARRAEQLHQGFHGVAGVDVVGPLGRGRQRCTRCLTPTPRGTRSGAPPPTPQGRHSSQGESRSRKEARHPREGLGLGGSALRPGGAAFLQGGGRSMSQCTGPQRPLRGDGHQGENMGTHPGTPGGESQEGSAADRSLPCPRPQGTHGPRAPPWPPSCTCSAPPRRRVTESTHPWVWGAASSFPRHLGRPWGTQPAQGLGPAPYPSTQQLVGQHPH